MAAFAVQPVRFMALDMHKHYAMVGAVNKEQEVLLRPRKFTWPEFERWSKQHIGPGDVIVIEASGNAWHVYDQLVAREATVYVANPLLVKWIGAAPVKTDPHDTLKLAKLLAAGMLPTIWVPPAHVRALRTLVGQRQRWIQQRPQARNRLQSLLQSHNRLPPEGDPFASEQRAWWQALDLPPGERLLVAQDLLALNQLAPLIDQVETALQMQSTCKPWASEVPWLGGIVPYGYYVEGKKKDARLVISEETLPGINMTEADVVRYIYRLLAEEGKSCQEVADLLNGLGVPPAYTKDGRPLLRGKRRGATSGLWRTGRVRNLVVSTTYKGLHEYGKRSKRNKELVQRQVPAIVDSETWERAQSTLRSHLTIRKNTDGRRYLLRGLFRWGCCGLTYCRVGWRDSGGGAKTYCRCNAAQQYRGLYGAKHQRCPSKAVSGDIEDQVWADIEEFGRNPGAVLEQLAQAQQGKARDADRLAAEIERLARSIQAKASERDQVITWCRRGRISEDDMDRQLEQIQLEEAGLKKESERVSELAQSAEAASAQLGTAEQLLVDLNSKLNLPITWELKRQLVETLVEEIVAETIESDGKKEAIVHVTYRFGAPEHRRATLAEDHTGIDSSPSPA